MFRRKRLGCHGGEKMLEGIALWFHEQMNWAEPLFYFLGVVACIKYLLFGGGK